jgi:hypothetical protein
LPLPIANLRHFQLPIANCRLAFGSQLVSINVAFIYESQLAIGNRQLAIGNWQTALVAGKSKKMGLYLSRQGAA